MKVYAQAPSAPLRGVVRRFLVVEFSKERSDLHLPETGLIAAFRLRGECLLSGRALPSAAVLTGLTDHVRQHHHSRDNAMLVVHFTPLGTSTFTREPLDAFWNRSEDLGTVLNCSAHVAEIADRLAEATDHARRIQIVERFLTARMTEHEPDPLIRAAVDWIERAPPSARVSDLVRHIGLSQSALERRFRRQVGAAPRRFISLLRFGRAAQLFRKGSSLTTAAHAAGYYDQAHFNHDFSRLTGLAPSAFFAQEKG